MSASFYGVHVTHLLEFCVVLFCFVSLHSASSVLCYLHLVWCPMFPASGLVSYVACVSSGVLCYLRLCIVHFWVPLQISLLCTLNFRIIMSIMLWYSIWTITHVAKSTLGFIVVKPLKYLPCNDMPATTPNKLPLIRNCWRLSFTCKGHDMPHTQGTQISKHRLWNLIYPAAEKLGHISVPPFSLVELRSSLYFHSR